MATITTVEVGPRVPKTPGGNSAFHNFHNDFTHVMNLNERRRLALTEIDNASFSWYHVRTCVVAGMGFFADSYDIFVVSMLTVMLGIVYWPQNQGVMPKSTDTAIKAATSSGTVIGQLGFGILADIVGRKRMYGVELIIILVATVSQCLCSASPSMSIAGLIIFWRIIMGIGIGGDYPLSAIITSEFAPTKWRGAMMGAVFAMQGFGQLAGAIVMVCLAAGFKGTLQQFQSYSTCTGDCAIAVDKMWRVLIGFGAFPATFALYYRLTIPETPRYTFDIRRDVEKGKEDVNAFISGRQFGDYNEIRRLEAMRAIEQLTMPKADFKDFLNYFGQWRNGKILLGTAGSWFVLDVAFYGLGLNTNAVLTAIGFANGNNVYELLYNLAAGNCILLCAGAIPGYWCTVALIDTIGRRPIQMMGFICLTALFLVWGFDYFGITPTAAFAIYALAQFFFNFGPNATTFIVPGECFPTRYRSTSHGISAASGKLGSIIAQTVIAPQRTNGALPNATGALASPWQNNVMKIYAFFMLSGCLLTLLIPETKRLTLEQLASETRDTASGRRNPSVSENGASESGKDEEPDSFRSQMF